MTEDNRDRLFERIADEYAEQYGRQVREEAEALEREQVGYVTPRLDSRIRREQGREKRRRRTRSLALLAACVALMILAPQLLRQGPVPASDQAGTASSSAAAEAAGEGEPSGNWAESAADNVIPLSFSLPAGVTVTDVEEDNGKSVYRLRDSMEDHIVMTLERTPLDEEYKGLSPLEIGGETVYGLSGPDFQLLAFQQEDVTLVLTCKYDINTLVNLTRHIV